MTKIKIILAVLVLAIIGGGVYYFSLLEQEKMVAEENARQERLVLQQRQAAEAAEQAKLKCSETDKYFVITRNHDNDAAGQDILVKNKVEGVTNDCKYLASEGDFEIKGDEAIYFKDLKENAMVADIGTGPSGRTFKIYDLNDKNMVVEKPYFEDLNITDNTLTYFGLSKNASDAKKCKSEETYVIKKTIDLKSYSAKESKETKCVATQ